MSCPCTPCTSQTCRGCRGNWKFGSLEAWKLGFPQCAPPVARKGAPAFPVSPESPVGRASWHIADVPGVQGRGALRPDRTRGKRDRQTTVRESIAVTFYCDVLQARPSDVPGVQGELLPAGAWGSAPHLPINQSPNHPKSLCVLCVLSDFQNTLAVQRAVARP